jgi:hypothetical protein
MSAVVTPIISKTITSITDRPIESLDADLLSVEHYAKALKNFIVESNTPLTIGMQGEWGTGKTSLMHLVKELLDNDDVATAWVNTWEYSLFKSANETTPAVLKGLLEKLVQSCKERGHWKNTEEFEAMKEKAVNGMKIIGAFAARVAVQKATGESVDIDFSRSDSLVSEVAELKQQIQDLINTIVSNNKNPLKKVVFFVDDLDRIEPADAVEVLESLKNIFDIDNCVFVLAIDYDVVIKGLEKKFGKKTDANEREFRSFFDKIIQVPFSMPVGTYGIDNLLDTKLRELGVSIPEEFKERFLDVLGLTVGYNPRSVKRFINTYSLLKRIKQFKNSDDASDSIAEFTLFSLIGIQIAYPKIFRQLNKNLHYPEWDAGFATKIGLDLGKAEEELSRVGDHELLDEKWETVVWAYCQGDAYLKARAFNILKVLNVMRETLEKENLPERLEAAMEFASMTSVDDDVESKATGVGVRDTTKYRFNGQPYNKARLVHAVVQAFVETKGKGMTLEQLREIFPDSLQGSLGVVHELKAVEEKYAGKSKKRHYLGPKDQLKLSDCVAVVCNQWGITNINNFIDQARKKGMEIVPA